MIHIDDRRKVKVIRMWEETRSVTCKKKQFNLNKYINDEINNNNKKKSFV